jgi:hypothetical protein
MAYTRRQITFTGANPFVLEGPYVLGQGTFFPIYSPGEKTQGDAGAEFIYCKLVLGGSTTLREGQAYTIDKDFTATLLTTSNSPRGTFVGIGRVDNPVAFAAGTYYIWLQIAGNSPVRYTGSNNALCETTATGGLLNFTNTPTTSSKYVVGIYGLDLGTTFTADVTSGSPILINPSSLNSVCLGQQLSATGIAASQTISFIYSQGELSGVPFGKIPNSIELSANATVTGTGVTITPTVCGVATLNYPYIDKTN